METDIRTFAEHYLEQNRDLMLHTLKNWVLTDSATASPEHTAQFGKLLKSAFEMLGFSCELLPTGQGTAPVLSGIWVPEHADFSEPILFSGHMDTTQSCFFYHEEGFRQENGRLCGHGVLDMKGGILITLFTVKLLQALSFSGRPIQILFAGDEEQLHQGADTAAILQHQAAGALCAFNMETGLPDGRLCIGRKGKLEARMQVHGLAAHAGNDFQKGKNAVVEMAYKVAALSNLTDLPSGISISPGVIHGGSSSGSVPDLCELLTDIRCRTPKQLNDIKQELAVIAADTRIPGTSCTLDYPMEMAPFETTSQTLSLLSLVQSTAKSIGLSVPGSTCLGGSSDASYLTLAGVPTLCSCGICGEGNHTPEEYGFTDSIRERILLWTFVCFKLSEENFVF